MRTKETRREEVEEECLLWANVENCNLNEGRRRSEEEKDIQWARSASSPRKGIRAISTYETKM
jgi:hypothetical protein